MINEPHHCKRRLLLLPAHAALPGPFRRHPSFPIPKAESTPQRLASDGPSLRQHSSLTADILPLDRSKRLGPSETASQRALAQRNPFPALKERPSRTALFRGTEHLTDPSSITMFLSMSLLKGFGGSNSKFACSTALLLRKYRGRMYAASLERRKSWPTVYRARRETGSTSSLTISCQRSRTHQYPAHTVPRRSQCCPVHPTRILEVSTRR